MAPPLLQMSDIRFTLGGKPLLDGVDLSVGRGDRICLVGRNGSGKSTLMKMVAGTVEPDSGMRFLQPDASLRVLPQEPDLSGFATVLDYVEAGLGPTDNPYRARTLLEDLGLDGSEEPSRLSGGEERRAALVRVLAPEPDILLLDEPTNHLDLPAIEWLEAELGSLRSALVLVSHDRRFLTNCRAPRSGSIAARPAGSSGVSGPSRTGATRHWRTRSATATSSTARSRPRKIGSATA